MTSSVVDLRSDFEVGKNDSTNVLQDANHMNFFDIEYPEIPNDDERVANNLNKNKSDSRRSSVSGSNINTTDFLVDNTRNDADSSKLKYFLRIKVVDTDKGICLNQRKYVLDLLSEYGILTRKPAKTPLMSKLVISKEACQNDPLLENVTDYQKLIGKLIYLTNTTPDISYDVHCLSQFMHSSLSSHLKIAFKILRYLKSSPGLGIHIASTSDMFLNAYSDADWANCIVTRKLVIGIVCFLITLSFLGKVRNKILSLNLQRKQSIELLLHCVEGLTVNEQRFKVKGLVLPSVDSFKSVLKEQNLRKKDVAGKENRVMDDGNHLVNEIDSDMEEDVVVVLDKFTSDYDVFCLVIKKFKSRMIYCF
ncbi:ribonuclease H-like domain-containing protein [Tanacetum coccineum]